MRENKYSKRDYLKPDEFLRFLQAAKNRGPMEHSIMLLLCIGFRLPEIQKIRVQDIDFQHEDARSNNLHIRRGIFGPHRKVCRYGTRILTSLPSNPVFCLRRSLREWLKLIFKIRKTHKSGPWEPNPTDKVDEVGVYVFNSHRSERLTRSSLDSLFESLCRRADIRLYDAPVLPFKKDDEFKFDRAFLKNVPVRLTLGPDALRRSLVEYKKATTTEADSSQEVHRALMRAFKDVKPKPLPSKAIYPPGSHKRKRLF